MSRIIAVANQKGGVGKTTTAVNLAACLAAAGQDVLVVDMDPQGNATSGLGVSLRAEDTSLYHVLIGQAQPGAAMRDTALPHLKILGSEVNLFGAEMELAQLPNRERLLTGALAALGQRFRFIFLDCPPSLGLLTLNALTACQGVLIPLQTEYYALEGLTQLLHTVARVRRAWNQSLKLDGIALTMYDGRNNLCRQVEDDVRGHFKHLVFKTVVPRNVRLSEAPSFGKPAILYDPKSTGSQAYLALARELMVNLRGGGASEGEQTRREAVA
ncbi:chromosome partitioning protein ParA [Desulfocarbo indianensis]|nr:chromosome partitioning protein ParA [Desulfocarbo indianensis]